MERNLWRRWNEGQNSCSDWMDEIKWVVGGGEAGPERKMRMSLAQPYC